jgi:hypothetical protein
VRSGRRAACQAASRGARTAEQLGGGFQWRRVGDRVARAGGGKGPLIFLYFEYVTVLVARRERLQRLAVTFGAEPPKYGQLEVLSDATAEQRARLAAWLATSRSVSASR